MNEIRPLVDDAFEHVTILIRHVVNYLSSPTPQGKQQLHAVLGEAYSTLKSADTFAEKQDSDCDQSCTILSREISRLDAESRSLEKQLQHLTTEQKGVEHSIKLTEREITFYEYLKQKSESEAKEMKANNVAFTLKISWISLIGTELCYMNLHQNS